MGGRKDRTARNQYAKEYRARRREYFHHVDRRRYQKEKGHRIAYYYANRKRYLSQARTRYAANREWQLQRSRKYRADHPEKVRKTLADYRRRNRERLCARSAERRRVVKRIVLTHYGNGAFRCTCCDETIEEFLTIDHLNGKGKDDRLARCGREQNSHAFYLALISQSFPKGYSTRCLNCNLGRRGTPDGRCPHKLAVG